MKTYDVTITEILQMTVPIESGEPCGSGTDCRGKLERQPVYFGRGPLCGG